MNGLKLSKTKNVDWSRTTVWLRGVGTTAPFAGGPPAAGAGAGLVASAGLVAPAAVVAAGAAVLVGSAGLVASAGVVAAAAAGVFVGAAAAGFGASVGFAGAGVAVGAAAGAQACQSAAAGSTAAARPTPRRKRRRVTPLRRADVESADVGWLDIAFSFARTETGVYLLGAGVTVGVGVVVGVAEPPGDDSTAPAEIPDVFEEPDTSVGTASILLPAKLRCSPPQPTASSRPPHRPSKKARREPDADILLLPREQTDGPGTIRAQSTGAESAMSNGARARRPGGGRRPGAYHQADGPEAASGADAPGDPPRPGPRARPALPRLVAGLRHTRRTALHARRPRHVHLDRGPSARHAGHGRRPARPRARLPGRPAQGAGLEAAEPPPARLRPRPRPRGASATRRPQALDPPALPGRPAGPPGRTGRDRAGVRLLAALLRPGHDRLRLRRGRDARPRSAGGARAAGLAALSP